MHYESGGFTFSYVLYVIAIILFIIAVIFAIWFFSLDNQDDKHHHQDREQRKDAIDKELEKTKYLISSGGYIPYGDHCIPPNVSWDNFKYYREKLNKIIDNTEIKVN